MLNPESYAETAIGDLPEQFSRAMQDMRVLWDIATAMGRLRDRTAKGEAFLARIECIGSLSYGVRFYRDTSEGLVEFDATGMQEARDLVS